MSYKGTEEDTDVGAGGFLFCAGAKENESLVGCIELRFGDRETVDVPRFVAGGWLGC